MKREGVVKDEKTVKGVVMIRFRKAPLREGNLIKMDTKKNSIIIKNILQR